MVRGGIAMLDVGSWNLFIRCMDGAAMDGAAVVTLI